MCLFAWISAAMVATTYVLKKSGDIVAPIHTLVDINQGLTLIQMLLDLVQDDGSSPKLPLTYIEKLIQECELLNVLDPRLNALNSRGSAEKSILSEDQEVRSAAENFYLLHEILDSPLLLSLTFSGSAFL